jgi:hypothetical protein
MERKEYNNGFKQYYYKCQHCGCESVTEKPLGGFQPPALICDACGRNVVNTPIVLYYEDNSNIRPKVEQTYSESEMIDLLQKCVYDYFYKGRNKAIDPSIKFDFDKWFETNKKR